MLDPQIIKDEPEKIADMLKARGIEFDLDGLIHYDKERRKCITETDELRHLKNQIGVEIAAQKKAGKSATDTIAQMSRVATELESLETRRQEIEREYTRLAMSIPNMVDESVPIGVDESANVICKKSGELPQFDFEIRDHIDITENLKLVDLGRAAKVSGARFYYLCGDLVLLNNALISFALDFVTERGYRLIQPPYMINRAAMEGAVIAQDFEDVIYKIHDEDLYMIGTSEHAIAAMHSDEIIEGGDLPLRYVGVSPCFRREAGAHGRDQKGIFRVHQFDKIEQFVFCKPKDAPSQHEMMLQTAESFYDQLGIPYQVVLLSSGDMGKSAAKTFDIEAWMAGQNAYREIVSCSNCLDYQARRLHIRFRDKTNQDTTYVNTLNSTLVATSRVLVAIIENYQTKDGHIKIPQVLQRYLNGRREI